MQDEYNQDSRYNFQASGQRENAQLKARNPEQMSKKLLYNDQNAEFDIKNTCLCRLQQHWASLLTCQKTVNQCDITQAINYALKE